jgi:YVTN family beta-propeller protein
MGYIKSYIFQGDHRASGVAASILGIASFLLASASEAQLCAAYVANITSDNVTVIDARTHAVITTIPVGNAPDGIAASPDGAFVYVANAFSEDVSVIDTATQTVIDTIGVGQNPNGDASIDGSGQHRKRYGAPGRYRPDRGEAHRGQRRWYSERHHF